MGQEAPLSHITPYIGMVTYLLLLYYTGEQCTACVQDSWCVWREECFKFYDRLFLTISPVITNPSSSLPPLI